MTHDGLTVLFDLDGTLIDTAPDLIGVLNTMLAHKGLRGVPLSSARHLVGHGALAMLRHGHAEAGAPWDETQAPAELERFIALYRERIADESRAFAGLTDALDHLAASGARLGVATNKRTDLSVALLEALGLKSRFAAILGADAVSARKPAAAHLIEAVAACGGDPARAIMIGDNATDVNAARAAAMPCILVSFGYTETPAGQLEPDGLIDHFDMLPGEIARLVHDFRLTPI